MPFEIPLRKPQGRCLETNHVWLDAVARRFADLREEPTDRAQLAIDLAADGGLTPKEFILRGIGLTLERAGDPWMRISFWNDSAVIDLPNIPVGGAVHAVEMVLPVVTFLESFGFRLLDPSTGDLIQGPVREALVGAYILRQRKVERVAELTGGKPG